MLDLSSPRRIVSRGEGTNTWPGASFLPFVDCTASWCERRSTPDLGGGIAPGPARLPRCGAGHDVLGVVMLTFNRLADRPRWSRALLPVSRNGAGPDLGALMTLLAFTAVVLLTGCVAGPSMARKTVVVRSGDATHTVSATGALSGVAADGVLGVVPFAEADAVALRRGEAVSVTVDAVSRAPRSGRLLAIAPSAATISGVTEYYVTVTVVDRDAGLRDGQTARVTVTPCSHVMCWSCRTPR